MTTYAQRYVKLLPGDCDIPVLLDIHRLPGIARFIGIDSEHYFNYVTSTDGVYYYKVYLDEMLVGSVHLEQDRNTLTLSLLVIPEYQNLGIASRILEDVKSGVLISGFSEIRVSVERENVPSLHLFEKAGFVLRGEEDGQLDYIYDNNT